MEFGEKEMINGDDEYYYPDTFCPKCETRRFITFIDKLVKCSNCGNTIGEAKKK